METEKLPNCHKCQGSYIFVRYETPGQIKCSIYECELCKSKFIRATVEDLSPKFWGPNGLLEKK